MAEAVLKRAEELLDSAILGAAHGSEPLKIRVRKIVATFEHLYRGGHTPCVLGQLATSGIGSGARQSLRKSFEHWIDAISKLAAEAGMPPARARNFGEDWVARLQGALILQAATANAGPFKRAMSTLLELTRQTDTP